MTNDETEEANEKKCHLMNYKKSNYTYSTIFFSLYPTRDSMHTLLLRLRIVLTALIIWLPLFYLVRWGISLFSTTTRNLQEQIDKARDRIRLEPDPQAHLEDDSEEIIDTIISSKSDDNLDSVESTSSPSLEEKNDDDLLVQHDQEIQDTTDTDETSQQSSDELPTTETKHATSQLSAEKLAQTVDDIKYAALTYKERGKKDEYEKKLVEWISLIGDHEEFLIMLADHYFEAGQYVKAGTLLKKIIHINPENHRAIRQLGQIYANDNDKETAKLLLEKARDLKDDNPKYLISLVEIYYEEHNIRECITIVEKLSRLRPTNIDYLLTLWNLHEELNQPTKAHSYYMKVLELNPTNDEAKKAIKRLL